MKIKSFGCSFIFGSDLADNPEQKVEDNPVGQFSRLTWPALLAKKLDYEYCCHARPGSGNLQIAERILNECSSDQEQFFIINWTYIDRFDYIESQDQWQRLPVGLWQPWNTLRPGNQSFLDENYYKNLHSEYKDKLTTLIYIKSVIDTLTQKNIKYIMTYEDDLIFDKQWHLTPAVECLQQQVAPHLISFEGQTFLNWSRQHGYAESDRSHPLEQAHQAAADYMLDFLINKIQPS